MSKKDKELLSQKFMKDLKGVFKKHLGQEDIAIAVCFTLPSENWERVHWATNVSRTDGIKLFRESANAMNTKMN